MTYEQALNFDQKWTEKQAFNDLERYLLREEKPAMKAVAVAMKALKKRIPKKPIPYEKDSKEVLEEYSCPECNAPYDVLFDGKLKFCQWCGQALDWSE